jgi:hypothetical protein
VAADVYLKRQDGKVIDEVLDTGLMANSAHAPRRAYIMLLDGLSNTELKERLERDKESIPNLACIIEAGAMFTYGTGELPEHHLAEPQCHRHRCLVRPP